MPDATPLPGDTGEAQDTAAALRQQLITLRVQLTEKDQTIADLKEQLARTRVIYRSEARQ